MRYKVYHLLYRHKLQYLLALPYRPRLLPQLLNYPNPPQSTTHSPSQYKVSVPFTPPPLLHSNFPTQDRHDATLDHNWNITRPSSSCYRSVHKKLPFNVSLFARRRRSLLRFYLFLPFPPPNRRSTPPASPPPTSHPAHPLNSPACSRYRSGRSRLCPIA